MDPTRRVDSITDVIKVKTDLPKSKLKAIRFFKPSGLSFDAQEDQVERWLQ
ncbi:hypothetical protein GLOTRDRAFT_132790 [Gloeophyllum trabeum ATCC 11539]|uniref:Uncharacterized protein n=1 Tax=Gloeophyllum trabeum (strain ATCC 11539 / FP-39264 / Madison 617) TaxID=670483 RepID=S7PWL0_GLOTA|nr:uncharacterized protein GLOTRDRAFT_132790 [Gloeophyllum trabeum ATCC 11539]EPQ51986.1 hypothetical protein GLOTRDRAFT_132790 [Gloeophyllum trabeum ATCC 11539]